MRVFPLAFLLLAGAWSGCFEAGGDDAMSMGGGLEAAQAAAVAWAEGAQLIGAFAMERDAAEAIPAWMGGGAGVPEEVREATDGDVGDGQATWWMYMFQARMTSRKVAFAVSAQGEVAGPLEWLGEADDDDGSPVPEQPVGDVVDSTAVQSALAADARWTGVGAIVAWELTRPHVSDPAFWLVRAGDGPRGVLVAAVTADAGAVVCVGNGDGSISFQATNGVKTGSINAVTPDSGNLELGDGHRGLRVELSGSDEALNEIELTLTSPAGPGSTWTWSGGAPTVAFVPDPAGGTWTYELRLVSGAIANYVLRHETEGALLDCSPG
ncbi:MAG: hypothetical protein AABY18_07150 [Candidatus Thermoplasmatota archaeon]